MDWNKLARLYCLDLKIILQFSCFVQNHSMLAKISSFARLQLQYWDIMKGPWDRQENTNTNLIDVYDKDQPFLFRTDENKPFAIDRTKPEGAGFYSEGLSYKEFKVQWTICNTQTIQLLAQVWMQLHHI